MLLSGSLNRLTGFHHIGLACRDIVAEEAVLSLISYQRNGPVYDDPVLGIRCCFLTTPVTGAPCLELVEPLPGSSVLEPWLAQGVKMYHAAFMTSDLSATLLDIKAQRGRVLVAPTPAVAFGYRPVSFVMLPNMILIELITAA